MGYRARQGRLFQGTTLDYILKDPTAKGVRRANFCKSSDTRRHWEHKPESEWIFTECEPIVSEELWDRCNAILTQQQAKCTPRSKRPVQLFGGLTWCGVCGAKMYVKSNTPKYVCQKCCNKIAAVDLEDIFVEQIKEYLLSPTEIAHYLEQADQTIHTKKQLLEVLEKELTSVQQEMDQTYKLYINDRITDEEFGIRYRPCEGRKAQLREEIPQLQAEIDFLKINLLSSDEILHQARDLYSRWAELSHDEKCQVVQTIVEKITIGKEEIEIQLYYLPTHPESPDTSPPDPFHDDGSDESHKTTQSISPQKSAIRNSSKNVAKGSSIPGTAISP